MPQNLDTLMANGKSISGLTPELEALLKAIAPTMLPHLPKVTDAFYVRLLTSPATSVFLKDHVNKLDMLKGTHLAWLNSLFTQDIDIPFTEKMIKVGEAHVAIKLPLEFMVSATFLIQKELIQVIVDEFGGDKQQCSQALQAVNGVLGFSLVIMQQSYNLWD